MPTFIDAEVDLHLADSGYFLSARLNVSGVERGVAQALVNEAEQTCPYSKATCGNINSRSKSSEARRWAASAAAPRYHARNGA
jgi:organic hydroperoxide reductase OsmC/OhrA